MDNLNGKSHESQKDDCVECGNTHQIAQGTQGLVRN
jgi:hypothetical protein